VSDDFLRQRLAAHLDGQGLMRMYGAELGDVGPGRAELSVPYREELTQQYGLFHGAVIGTLLDNACTGAAGTLAPDGTAVITVEYKVNFLSPARGKRLLARARVVKAGRTLTVATGEAFSVGADGAEDLVAISQSTVMRIAGQPGLP
jgi:uncharacterized protein (TIGR00369 family)